MIEIENNKHLGIIFQPRSGSHVLRHYISNLLNRTPLGEWYNVNYQQPSIMIENNSITFRPADYKNRIPTTYLEEKLFLMKNIELLRNMSDINQYAVANIEPTGYIDHNLSDLLELIAQEKNMQFILLDRADVLYSIISLHLSILNKSFHNVSDVVKIRSVEPTILNIEFLDARLNKYIKNKDYINKYFGNLPKIYYEQFQFNVSNIRNLFTGIPKKIIGTGFNKWNGNHKDVISNLDEIEDYYEKFVNKYPEYFPQYFGKLPQITIPASQGKQPNILLPEYS